MALELLPITLSPFAGNTYSAAAATPATSSSAAATNDRPTGFLARYI
jgi:hypothetical protein